MFLIVKPEPPLSLPPPLLVSPLTSSPSLFPHSPLSPDQQLVDQKVQEEGAEQ